MKTEELREIAKKHATPTKWCRAMIEDIEHNPEGWQNIASPVGLEGSYQMSPEDALKLQETLMGKALEIMLRKRTDYSGSEDPFRNLRSSKFAGVKPWKGVIVRIMDKFSRIRSVTDAGGEMKVEESLEDTFIDIINYTCILAGLIYEENGIRV